MMVPWLTILEYYDTTAFRSLLYTEDVLNTFTELKYENTSEVLGSNL